MKRIAVAVPLLAVPLLAALLLSGCTANSGASTAEAPAGPIQPIPLDRADGGIAGEQFTGDSASEASAADSPVAVTERAVITTGFLAVTVDDPIAAADRAAGTVTGAGGRVDSRSETPAVDQQQARASLSLRIPSDRFDATVDELRELGDVTSFSSNASDVTQQTQDLAARIEALESSTARLRELIAGADTTADLIAIESELTTRQAELDSLVSQRDWLADQVDYSTLSLELSAPGIVPSAEPGDFWSGLVAGWSTLMAFGSWALVALGVLLPWLGLLALVAGLVVAIVLLARRGGRSRGAETPEEPRA